MSEQITLSEFQRRLEWIAAAAEEDPGLVGERRRLLRYLDWSRIWAEDTMVPWGMALESALDTMRDTSPAADLAYMAKNPAFVPLIDGILNRFKREADDA